MRTPICDFVEKYIREDNLRLHMPGHKGVSFLGIENRDITEVDGADVLYSANGIIAESERNAAELFGTAKTLYSTEGSSLCIRAMVYLLSLEAKQKGRKPVIWVARNAHKAFVSAVALTDVDVEWIFPTKSDSLICCDISAESLDVMLAQEKELPVAVYITSPDYLGHIPDVEGIAKVCHKHGVLLAVDNAHGAYLRFLPESRHPMDLGADICCDSAHKTLPTLTGGAYLHISKDAPKTFFDMAEQAMSLFASTQAGQMRV
jgi:arginine/lysine/ornithine decarboxylase